LINYGDPLLAKRNINTPLNGIEFDDGLGQSVYSNPEKSIFKVLTIDFNNDGLKDLIVAHNDGSIKLLKNYGGNNPYTDMNKLVVVVILL
jgi:hypothetical protein